MDYTPEKTFEITSTAPFGLWKGIIPYKQKKCGQWCPTRFCGRQVFSVLPVDAKTGAWSQPRVAYCVVVSGGLSALFLLSAFQHIVEHRTSLVGLSVFPQSRL